MTVSNLSQLKRAMQDGHDFIVVKHYAHPEYTGQVRSIKKCGKTFMFSGVKGEPQHKVSQLNHGEGCYLNFGKASDWEFSDGFCTMYNHLRNPIWTIKVI